MTIHYQDTDTTVYHGDCLDILPTLPDNSIDAVVTDPPYSSTHSQAPAPPAKQPSKNTNTPS
jgi:DNA modification methylase